MDGVGTAAVFQLPNVITMDTAGSVLYLTEANNGNIRSITTDGIVTTFATGGPQYMAGAAYGNGMLYVSNTNDATVCTVTQQGE